LTQKKRQWQPHQEDFKTPTFLVRLRSLRPSTLPYFRKQQYDHQFDFRSHPLQVSPLIPSRRALLPCAAAFVIFLAFVPRAGLAQSTINVDASRVIGPHSTTPLMTVGAGRANEGLRADWQQQLAVVQKEIGFKYLRFHGLLNDDMGVYFEDSTGKPIYNFQYVDSLYDALLALHIRPFVELSFMPAKLASGSKTVFWWNGNVTPPKDMDKWNGLIRALLQHWLQRYGEAEVSQWYYEVWNEPDLPNFWSGTQQQYFDLYRNTATDIKTVCPRCRVGGPASASPPMEVAWHAYIDREHLPADFDSTHTYGTTKGSIDADGHAGTVLSTNPDSIVARVCASRALFDKSSTPHMELHYTEWGSSYSPRDPIHDQYISAPFILEKLRLTSDLTQSMSYWTFTDIFEEDGPRVTPFHGGFGMINYQGIRKPAFFAYKFLAQLGPDDISTDDPHSWATRGRDGSVQVLFWNYTPVSSPAGETDQIFFSKEIFAKPIGKTTLKIAGLASGTFVLNVYRTGYRQNDPYSAYLSMGSPQQLTREQTVALQATASGKPIETREVVSQHGTFEYLSDLHDNDTVLVTLTKKQ
jgi:xylan 1,4-beta-xylosidase